MNSAYFECQSGASGDMFLGAWLDLGIDEDEWKRLLEGLGVTGYTLSRKPVFKNGIRSTKLDVILEDVAATNHHDHHHDHDHDHHHDHHHEHHHDHHHDHVHRNLPDILQILDRSQLPDPVITKSKEAFRLLAQAEGKIHGLPLDEVHFHEVGAVDAIVDIVGCMIGWYLAGMPKCYVSNIEVGGGTVWCQHGLMPVPAPATAELLRGFQTYSTGDFGETVTPTGAAIIRALCTPEKLPKFVSQKIGYGAGTKDFKMANVLRIQLGTVEDNRGASDRDSALQDNYEPIVVLEANVDDMTPEWAGYTAAKLLDSGALDAWWTPIVMKKGRPALQFHVVCHPADRERLIDLVERETTTLGVRVYETLRVVLDRRVEEVDTPYGRVRLKIAHKGAEVRNVAPEFEDCKRCAEEHDVPLKQVYQATLARYYGRAEM